MSSRSVVDLAQLVGAEVRGDGTALVDGVAGLVEAGSSHVTFFANRAYKKHLAVTKAAAVIVSYQDAEDPSLAGRTLIVAATPYAAFARIAQQFHPPPHVEPGIDPFARVEDGAEVHPSVRVEAFAFVGRGARIGAGTLVMSGAYVGAAADVGPGCLLYPKSVIRERCVVGARCILQPGAVVGGDGFGFAFDPEGDGDGPLLRKVPQAGIARLEDDVEIGANACVDRATMGETVVSRGAKIDNLVQIAHNVRIGPLTVLAAQTGIAGSTIIGAGVQMGGQSGATGHIEIGDMARIGAQAGVPSNIPAGATVHGFPAIDAKLWARASVLFGRLPELVKELRGLAKRVTALESRRD